MVPIDIWPEICEYCNGTGWEIEPEIVLLGEGYFSRAYERKKKCPACDGYGEVYRIDPYDTFDYPLDQGV